MRISLAIVAALSLAACEQKPAPVSPETAKLIADAEAAKVAADLRLSEATAAANAPAKISKADMGRVCRAVIATVMGRDPNIIKVTSVAGNIVQTRYARPDDGTVWKNQCRVQADKVIWAAVDAFGPGSGIGRWRDEDTLLYRVEPQGKIWIRFMMGSDLVSEKTLSVP